MASTNTPPQRILENLQDLAEFSLQIKEKLLFPSLLLLSGQLGAGKTAFTKKLASLYGFPENTVKSPSFSLINIYQNDLIQINHLDFYRLEAPDIFLQENLKELLSNPQSLTIVEWPERLELEKISHLPRQILQLNFQLKNQGEKTFRTVQIHDKSI
ncbi:tRNA (adenosine(37)-N6)-threonylcarbamoyltransferase complex ATPase subunit type 1 TsaE [Candidatus Peregrinibacteria bacterium]|nr:tRNA (adenosine(37)-N6)-threonylcarbamoyltransferase complex ATPase subunit type 1 TsaE [Candidatus Peregrinibacteria bacterium]